MSNPFESFIREREASGKESYKYFLSPFWRWLTRHGRGGNFNAGDLEEYFGDDACTLEKPASKNKLLNGLRGWVKHELKHLPFPEEGNQTAFYKYLVSKDRLERIKDFPRFRVSARTVRKALTMDEIMTLLGVMNRRDAHTSYWHMYLGPRPGELLDGIEKTERLDGGVWRVVIFASKTQKTRPRRTLYVPDNVMEVFHRITINKWLDIDYDALRIRLKSYDPAVEIHLTPNVFRHTFQTHMRNVLGDVDLVAAMMGHSVPRVQEDGTRRAQWVDVYDSVFGEEIREAMVEKHYLKDVPVPS